MSAKQAHDTYDRQVLRKVPLREAETMLKTEFGRQVENLLQKGYPNIARVTAEEFTKHIEPLKERINEFATLEKEPKEGHIPFVIVVKSDLVAREKAMQLVELKDKKGFTAMEVDDIKKFKPIEVIELPKEIAYLVVEIDTGKGTLNITPDEAMKLIKKENRARLSIDEGIALTTHYPEVSKKNNGFSLLGSRCGDRRVNTLWISGGKSKLG